MDKKIILLGVLLIVFICVTGTIIVWKTNIEHGEPKNYILVHLNGKEKQSLTAHLSNKEFVSYLENDLDTIASSVDNVTVVAIGETNTEADVLILRIGYDLNLSNSQRNSALSQIKSVLEHRWYVGITQYGYVKYCNDQFRVYINYGKEGDGIVANVSDKSFLSYLNQDLEAIASDVGEATVRNVTISSTDPSDNSLYIVVEYNANLSDLVKDDILNNKIMITLEQRWYVNYVKWEVIQVYGTN